MIKADFIKVRIVSVSCIFAACHQDMAAIDALIAAFETPEEIASTFKGENQEAREAILIGAVCLYEGQIWQARNKKGYSATNHHSEAALLFRSNGFGGKASELLHPAVYALVPKSQSAKDSEPSGAGL